MGTRSLTAFVDEQGKELVVMYRQYDGYIDYYGRKLHDYLATFDAVVNGIKGDDYVKRTANGMSCLSAQTIMHMKSQIENRDYNNRVFNPDTGHMESALQEGNHCGGVYLYPAGTRDCGEEYVYIVKCSVKKGIHLAAWKPGWKSIELEDQLIHEGYIRDGDWLGLALQREGVVQEKMNAAWKAYQAKKEAEQ